MNRAPVWTPDGSRLAYASGRGAAQHMFWQPTDRSGSAESLLASANILWPASWTPDGRALVYTEDPPTSNTDIRVLSLDTQRQTTSLPDIPARSVAPSLSSDGRWLAYVSFATSANRPDVSVQPYPGPGLRRQLAECGSEPVWRRDGRELFYRYQCGAPATPGGGAPAGDAIFAVPFDPARGAAIGPPVELFHGRFAPRARGERIYDVTPDGQRFLVVMASEDEFEPGRVDVILNLGDDLRRRAPATR